MLPLAALFDVGMKVLDKVLPNEEAKAQAMAKLQEMQINGKLAEMNVDLKSYEVEQNNLTERLKADMQSDSWLSKNIRPLTLIAILTGYFIFALMSAFDKDTNQAYVELLGQWGMLIMSFYFGGRTLEKILDARAKK
jgi:hypothetical protein